MNFYARSVSVRLLIKAAFLFIVLNLLIIPFDPLPLLGKLSIYGWLVPARSRLPYGEQPTKAYNLSVNTLEAMFAAHRVHQPKAADEYRVLLLGDSSVWGLLLHPEQTLDAYLNAADLRREGKRMRFYNLGYPVQSLTKDVMILDEARQYQPDLIVWLVTLEAFAPDQQLVPMLVRDNPKRLRNIPTLRLTDDENVKFINTTWQEHTLLGRRRDLADLLWLQIYGVLWGATGIDQVYPAAFQPTMAEFKASAFPQGLESWHGLKPEHKLTREDLAFDAVEAGVKLGVPIIIVNEPIFVSAGLNSDVRYNYFYPCWVYDQYRALLREVSTDRGWTLIDLWDAIPPTEFTDSPVHLTPAGSAMLAEKIATEMRSK